VSSPRRAKVSELSSLYRPMRRPPSNFDAAAASKRELGLYGLPYPPNPKSHPLSTRLWEAHTRDARDYEWVLPELSTRHIPGVEPNPHVTLDPDSLVSRFPMMDRVGVDVFELADVIRLMIRNASATTSTAWAGAFAPRPAGEAFNNVFGRFTVPTVRPPLSANALGGWKDGIYESAVWVGLDGWNGPDVMQSGIECVATVTKGALTTSYRAWVEFWPAPPQWVDNFPISPGDNLTVLVCNPYSNTHAAAVLTNKTTGTVVTVGFDATGMTVVTGVVAEWIVELATPPPGTKTELADFGTIAIRECVAAGPKHEVDLLTATPINMVDASGNVIARANLETSNEVDITRV
jgi:hypothetical protein